MTKVHKLIRTNLNEKVNINKNSIDIKMKKSHNRITKASTTITIIYDKNTSKDKN